MLRLLYPYEYVESVFEIDYPALAAQGFCAALFDIDNTLVPHGADGTPEVHALLRRVQQAGLQPFLLTNNDEARVRRFLGELDLPYLCGADKPAPAGYQKALKQLGVSKQQAVCIGDQMFTDIFGANRCGIPCILVHYIRKPGETDPGKRRRAENAVLFFYRRSRAFRQRLGGIGPEPRPERRLFCERGPVCYAISEQKEILLRHLQNLRRPVRFAKARQPQPLPNLVSAQASHLIKRGKGIDPVLQQNKAVNIRLACGRINGLLLRPGESFSFWHTVGKTTRRKGYREGRTLVEGRLHPGLGGGLCNLANSLHRLVLDSPLTVTEFHNHSDALAPDEGPRVPFSSGTSVNYNALDYRFQNNTEQTVQLLCWCDADELHAELRSERPFPLRYALLEEDHHFRREGQHWYRVSKIYKLSIDRASGEIVEKQLVLDNHSQVMYDTSMIPPALIRPPAEKPAMVKTQNG